MFADTLPAFDDDVWELYNANTDWTQAHGVVAQHPDKRFRGLGEP
jgi:arylsulfatase